MSIDNQFLVYYCPNCGSRVKGNVPGFNDKFILSCFDCSFRVFINKRNDDKFYFSFSRYPLNKGGRSDHMTVQTEKAEDGMNFDENKYDYSEEVYKEYEEEVGDNQ